MIPKQVKMLPAKMHYFTFRCKSEHKNYFFVNPSLFFVMIPVFIFKHCVSRLATYEAKAFQKWVLQAFLEQMKREDKLSDILFVFNKTSCSEINTALN
jgi:hypothetical protein